MTFRKATPVQTKQPAIEPIQPSDLLRKAMEAGDVFALFSVLDSWSQADLKQLIADVEAWSETVQGVIDKVHAEQAFLPGNFFNKARSKALDAAVDRQRMDVLSQCSEICSVALFYIKE